MIKKTYIRTILYSMLVVTCLYAEPVFPQPSDSVRQSNIKVGKDNPFSKLPKKKEEILISHISTTLSDAGGTKQIPKLFIEAVTIDSLNAKSLKEALEALSSQSGSICVDEKSNSLIICDTRKNLDMILSEIKKTDKPHPGLFVETLTLKFLEAKNLKKAIDGMSSQYGNISTDSATNSLIVCDTSSKLEEIIAEIRKADKTPEQIMIEVVIIDVQLEDDTEIGVNWNRLFDTKRDESYTQSLVTTLATAGTIGADFSLLKSSISGTIHALQQSRKIEILASPHVLVVSGQEASIKTIEEIPYEEVSDTADGGANALTSTKFKEVGVTLKVKATLTDKRKILMTVEPEQSVKTGESIGEVPVVDTRGAKTSLLMEDGQVVIMGGLRRKETRLTTYKVPLLGDLPLIGFLFANNKEEVNHSELIVLISPHIHKGEPVSEEVAEKFNELKERPMLSLPKK